MAAPHLNVLVMAVVAVAMRVEEQHSRNVLRNAPAALHTGANETFMKRVAWIYSGGNNWTNRRLPQADTNRTYGQRGEQHSQAGQDWLVQSILQCPTGGYFVDLAANSARTLSNSLMIERDFSWSGLCIEPNPAYFHEFSHRKCQLVVAAVGTPTDTVVEFNVKAGVFGGIVDPTMDNKHAEAKPLRLQTVALADILMRFEAPRIIDYFSLDVEGAESMVMQGFPWHKFKFRILTIERPKPDLVATLNSNGYEELRKNSGFLDTTWINTQLVGQQIAQLRLMWANGATTAPTCMTERGYPRPTKLLPF